MPSKHTLPLLGQLVKLIPAKIIDTLARKHKIQTRSFSPTSHVVAMMYAQLSHALSLNDVCDSLRNHSGTLSQIRHCTPPSRNGLSNANRTRNADMIEELFWKVFGSIKQDHPAFLTSRNYPGLPHRFKRAIKAVDSSTISLVANSMDWAKHRRKKAAAKLHMSLDMHSFLPSFAIVRKAKQTDPKVAWELCASLNAGEVVVFDKAYVDFPHLYHLDQRNVFWVTRAKENMSYEVVEVMGQQVCSNSQQAENPAVQGEKVMGQQDSKKRKYQRQGIDIISDEKIVLITASSQSKYPGKLRLVTAKVKVKKEKKVMKFITNNFDWSATSICELYKARWGIEVFFKELKQTLQLADFMGYNENAVRWQIWTSLLVYLLLRFVAWKNNWNYSFRRLFTLVRAVIWNYFNLKSIMDCCGKKKLRKIVRAAPDQSYQLEFDFG